MQRKQIRIAPQPNTSIKDELNFELENYTIFAGENNAGKTNLMKALKDFLPKEQTIYIPAERILAEEELKTGSKEDPMRSAILKLIDVALDGLPQINYEKIGNLLQNISQTFDSFKVENIKLKFDIKQLNENDFKKIIKDEISKKILDSTINDSYGQVCDLTIEKVGQGTQRLIIASILQELSKVNLRDQELFLIFEEPEIYLHPKLKRSLYNALNELSKNNTRVILTTHDPYFIELGEGQKIYRVSRDGNDGATTIKIYPSSVLGRSSQAEINYIIFGIPSTDYFLQLYQKADSDGIEFKNYMVVPNIPIEDVRAALAHPNNSGGQRGIAQPNVTEDIKKKSIDYLRSIL